VAGRFVSMYRNFRVVREENQGLSHARNRGWREAIGGYVAYIDDDAIALPDWVAQINAFTERRPRVLAFGGPYDSFSLVPVPAWFPPEYGKWSLGEKERPIDVGIEWINGTNMIFKKELLSDLNGFNSKLGMSGTRISYGEETNLLLELQKCKIPVYYVPTIKVQHLIADYKMRLTWLLFSSYKIGRCSALTLGVQRSLYAHLSNIVINIFTGVTKMLNSGAEPFKKRIFVSFSPLFIELGTLVEYFLTKMR
jgi:cellulose synthase/poly-beta-1,6-N-acetylglucosamine synthase-like glycosyltransferase